MKTAIVYSSKHGTTKNVSEIIKSKLANDDVELFNLNEKPRVEFSRFDRIIIGSSVYAGAVQPKARKFVEQNMIDLLQKEVAIFVCCMFFDKAYEQIEKGFPEALRKHAISIKHLGGEFRFEEMNAIERFLVKKIAGASKSVSKIDQTTIDAFINEINNN
jgi:menaquinone-dependent protoporphyrinogen oxidase